MSFVVDASVTLRWLLPTQADAASAKLLERAEQQQIVVPELWHLEVSNQLGIRRHNGKISQDVLQRGLNLIQILDIRTVQSDFNSPAPVLELMARHDLSAYDAIYLDLADSLRMPLATFDGKMIAAAQRAGIGLLP